MGRLAALGRAEFLVVCVLGLQAVPQAVRLLPDVNSC